MLAERLASVLDVDYHDDDFDWEDHRRAVEHLIPPFAGRELSESEVSIPAALAEDIERSRSADGASPSTASSQDQDAPPLRLPWERFHGLRAHSTEPFFKPRRYLIREFPCLLERGRPLRVLEVGCGTGSAALPVLLANPDACVAAVDFSPSAVRSAAAAAANVGFGFDRFASFVADCTLREEDAPPGGAGGPETVWRGLQAAWRDGWGTPLAWRAAEGERRDLAPAGAEAGGPAAAAAERAEEPRGGQAGPPSDDDEGVADVALLIFVLSAVHPSKAANLVSAVLRCLRPGGLVCVRDYALFDLPHLRFPESKRLGERLYQRGDGTLARFFHLEEMQELGRSAGAEPVEGRWACVDVSNHKMKAHMRRCFVHAVWRKPEWKAAPAAAGSSSDQRQHHQQQERRVVPPAPAPAG